MTPPPSFLDQVHIERLDDSRTAVTVVLPSSLVHDFRRFLESVSSLFHCADRKSPVDSLDAAEKRAALESEAERRLAAYHARLVKAFDDYTASGLDRKAAIKRVAADLRAVNHPWCCPDLVRSELVKLGRSGKSGGPRKVQP